MIRFLKDADLRAEWGRQAAESAMAFLAVVAALLWAGRLRRWTRRLLISLAAGVGIAIPLWQFFAVRLAIDHVYNKPVTLGWGLWLMPVGFVLAGIAAWHQPLTTEEDR